MSISAPQADERDDRTLRTIAGLVGSEGAALAWTHFMAGRVVVGATAATLLAPNGLLAATATLNMLSRFVGTVQLLVEGVAPPWLDAELDRVIARVGAIDTRTGRCIQRAARAARVPPVAAVWLGDQPPRDIVALGDGLIGVAFDGWRCAVRRSDGAGSVVASQVPFGALTAACLAAAEVFKTLLATSVAPVDAERVRRRYTREWSFSAWSMEAIGAVTIDLTAPDDASPPDPLPPVTLDGVVQVGAGAVGNATVLAFANTSGLEAALPVFDAKVVDLKNLNRCYYFAESDVGTPKVEVLTAQAARDGFRVVGHGSNFTPREVRRTPILLSTVDNNEARHSMQEAMPRVLVQGATGGTTIAVSVHSAVDGRSCLVCRHPDPTVGTSRPVPLSLAEAAAATGLTINELATGRVDDSTAIADAVIERVASRSPELAEVLRSAREAGQDLCGAIGDLRQAFGTIVGPREASVPFVSNLAGVLAAAEVVKLRLRECGAADPPALDNVLQLDLARDYSRHPRLAFREPPLTDCALCQDRAREVFRLYHQRWGRGT